MQTFVATLVLFAIVMCAMALGVMVTGRSLKGSCGGATGACPCSDEERTACPKRREA